MTDDRGYEQTPRPNKNLTCPFCGQATFHLFPQLLSWQCYTCRAAGRIEKLPGGEWPSYDDLPSPHGPQGYG